MSSSHHSNSVLIFFIQKDMLIINGLITIILFEFHTLYLDLIDLQFMRESELRLFLSNCF